MKTQAQLANTCRLRARALSDEALRHDRGSQIRGDLLHAAAQLARLALDHNSGATLEPVSVSAYCDTALDLICAAFGLRIDRHERKVAAHG